MDQERIFLAYAHRRRRRLIAMAVTLGLLGLEALFARDLTESSATVVAFLILGGFLLFLWIDWRCPACDGHLGREFSQRHCSHCGTRLTP